MVNRNRDPYAAPEQAVMALSGKCYGHPGHKDGTEIVTSAIVGKREGKFDWYVVTKSGTQYAPGKVDPKYKTIYPNAYRRLLAGLKVL